MAIVRELVTLLRYQNDEAGLQAHENGFKKLAAWAAGLFAGIKITEIADAWATVGARVGLATTSVADQETALAALYEMSQRTGQSYVETAGLFTTVGRNAKMLGLDLKQQLALTETINQAITIGGGSAASTKAALTQFSQSLGSGKVQAEEWNSVVEQAPRLAMAVADSFDVTVGGMKQLINTGKITSKMLAESVMKQSAKLSAEFAKMPMTFARAFQTVENRFGKFINDIGRATGLWQTLARAIAQGSEWAFDKVYQLADIVGGLGNLLEAAGIVLAAAFGPGALMLIARMITALRGMTVASFLAAAPWYLLAALILAVGLAVQDVWTWMEGGPSLIGDMIGPWSEWRDTVLAWRDAAKAALAALVPDTATLAVWGSAFATAMGQAIKDVLALSAEITNLRTALGLVGENWGFAHMVNKMREDFVTMRLMAQEIKDFFTGRKQEADEAPRRIAPRLAEIKPSWMVDADPSGAPVPPMAQPWAGQASEGGKGFVDFLRSMRPSWMVDAVPNIKPSALTPAAQTTTVTATVTNNITTTTDTPQAVGDAAANGTKQGLSESLGRSLGIMSPAVEYGVGY